MASDDIEVEPRIAGDTSPPTIPGAHQDHIPLAIGEQTEGLESVEQVETKRPVRPPFMQCVICRA